MTLIRDKHFQTGLAGSLAIHAVLLLLLTWSFGVNVAQQWRQQEAELAPKLVEKEAALVFPEQIIPAELLPAPPPTPAATPQTKAYIRTADNAAAVTKPARPAFASDRDTVAASKKAPAPDGKDNMPSMDGIEQKTTDLANRDLREGEGRGEAGGGAASSAAEMAKAETSAETGPAEELEGETVNIEIRAVPLQVRERPESAEDALPRFVLNPDKDGFSAMTRASGVSGTISSRGDENAVDAERTPVGAYMHEVSKHVEKKWHLYGKPKKADVAPGSSLRVRFFVTKSGKVENLEIISDPAHASPVLAEFTERAIKEAEIPPIPADLLPTLEGERIKIEYDVLIY